MDDVQDLIDEREESRRWPMIAVVVVLIVALGLIAWDQRPWAASSGNESGLGMLADTSPRRAGAAPDFALLDESGERFALSDFQGQPVFLNFWATWCTFCKEEMPDMERVHQEYGDGLVVIGVNAGDSVEDGEDFVRKSGVTYLRLYDSDLSVTDGYLVQAMPTSYFITPDGTISDANFGFMVYDQMVEQIEQASQG